MLVVLMLYLLVTFVLGLMSTKKGGSAKSFHGSSLGVLMCVVAGAGEWMGGTATTGVSEYGYLYGISGSWYTIANGIGIMICAIFFAKLYRSLNTQTVPGIIGHFIGNRARTVASIILIFVMLAVGVSQMIAIGTLGNILFHLDINLSILILGVFVIIYTLFGGMVAVSYTNTLHLITMYVGMLVAVIYSINNLGGVSSIHRSLPERYFNLTSIGMPKVWSWIIASILGACTAQAGIQPILAAKNEKVAKKSAIWIALIVAPFGIMTAILGMIAKIRFPELSNAKIALPSLMQDMPDLISGLVLAAILAAILSTASPIFLACGTLFTRDIFLRYNKSSKVDELKVSRLVTAIAGIICIGVALLLYNSSAVLDIVYFAYSLRGSLFIVLLFGIYSKGHKLKETDAIKSMIITSITGMIWIVYKAVFGSYPFSPFFSETYATVIMALFTMLLFKLLDRKEIMTSRK